MRGQPPTFPSPLVAFAVKIFLPQELALPGKDPVSPGMLLKFVCGLAPLKLVLESNPYFQVLRGWELNPLRVFINFFFQFCGLNSGLHTC
jgi:hypothetical protein